MAKGLKSGLSTGTCAAAAARAACLLMRGERDVSEVDVVLPGGERVWFTVHNPALRNGEFRAYVFKDGGDDPDATHGLRIGAGVSPSGVFRVEAGPGVGVVTRPGLAALPGGPAINPVPLEMIKREVARSYARPVRVRVIVPRGREIAAKTFNPRLGIVAGISILGTTGRVRPFSLSALRETVRLSLRQADAAGLERIVLVPGNMGRRFARAQGYAPQQVLEVGNEWGAALDCLAREVVLQADVCGHPGKLLKLCRGEFDTHSQRSKPALSVAQKKMAKLGLSFWAQARTVQEILDRMQEEERWIVCCALARDVLEAVQAKGGGQICSVRLIDLQGKELGRAE
ncbi:MAG: cobalt-precorrin-5B (C(1))-methyltransferase CbiD [Desulfonatronovibrionaceae bacterium]